MAIDTGHAASRSCERCGSPNGLDFGERSVCEECYTLAGSCCLEFGADDLWKGREGEPESSSAVTPS